MTQSGKREFGDLCLMRAVEIDESGNPVQDGLIKNFIFDKGTERYVFTDPGNGLPYLVDRREKLLARRREA